MELVQRSSGHLSKNRSIYAFLAFYVLPPVLLLPFFLGWFSWGPVSTAIAVLPVFALAYQLRMHAASRRVPITTMHLEAERRFGQIRLAGSRKGREVEAHIGADLASELRYAFGEAERSWAFLFIWGAWGIVGHMASRLFNPKLALTGAVHTNADVDLSIVGREGKTEATGDPAFDLQFDARESDLVHLDAETRQALLDAAEGSEEVAVHGTHITGAGWSSMLGPEELLSNLERVAQALERPVTTERLLAMASDDEETLPVPRAAAKELASRKERLALKSLLAQTLDSTIKTEVLRGLGVEGALSVGSQEAGGLSKPQAAKAGRATLAKG